MSILSTTFVAIAFFGFRPRLAPVIGGATDSLSVTFTGLPGFFLPEISAVLTAATGFLISMLPALAMGLDVVTVFALNSGLLITGIPATLAIALGDGRETEFPVTSVPGLAETSAGFLNF
jgi:hypothetical protein